jgi:hypothetical protein
VEDEHWNDLSPVAPSEQGTESATERKSPYSITVGGLPLCDISQLKSLGFNDPVWTWTRRMVVINRL